ncbi:hypothetical protein Pmani_011987 [Petrolisthes manimaculis]|uniref:Secreted protein n=1 Tax=Petrolisthes manimaculis TaxID=1843537 RepID=A0AAE1Q1F8_9EUCA|nr:hypothetical protein Pmani_011987 [Petrolisthes manimaculis]
MVMLLVLVMKVLLLNDHLGSCGLPEVSVMPPDSCIAKTFHKWCINVGISLWLEAGVLCIPPQKVARTPGRLDY